MKRVGRSPVEVNINSPQDNHIPVFDLENRLWYTIPTSSIVTTVTNLSGSQTITGNLTVSGSIFAYNITSSLFGTASWARNSISASYLSGSQGIVNTFTSSGDIRVRNFTISAGQSGAFDNISIGSGSLLATSSLPVVGADNNIAIGNRTLTQGILGANNVAIGYSALQHTTSSYSTAVGAYALWQSISGRNTAFGQAALAYITTGSNNTGLGDAVMFFTVKGTNNTAVGNIALRSMTEGDQNTALGSGVMHLDFRSGSANTVIGFDTGRGIITGSNNTIIGANVANLPSTLNNNIILSDGQGNIRARYSSSVWYLSDSVLGSFTGSLLGTSSWAVNALTASLAPNYLPLTGGTINGDVTINGTASISFLNVIYQTASVVYSSGSNQFGDAIEDVQTLIGSVIVSGSQTITGSLISPSITGSLLGTASSALTASNILGGTATYIPFFKTNTTLGNSTIFQVSSSFSTTSIAINETNITSDNPEALYVFQTHPTSINVLTGKGNLNNYLQNNIQNTNQGVSASSDVVATANNGSETTNYIDMGINSQNYGAGFIGGANDAYLYSIANNLHIGNANDNGTHVGFFVGGSDVEAYNKLQLNPNNQHKMSGSLDISGSLSVNNGITGSLFGTASWAINALTASYASNVPDTASYALQAISASNALTASYALYAEASEFPYTGSAVISGSLIVTGSVIATLGFTGSLEGTASWANNSISASYSISSSYSLTSSFAVSASVSATSSFADSASYALSASQAQNAISSSYVLNAVSSSFANSASYALSSSQAESAITASYVLNAISASYSVTSSYAISASEAQNAVTASYVLNSVSASFATSASYALSASQAQNSVSASYVLNAVSASYATSASQAQNAVTASYVENAVSSSFALTASSADNFTVRGTLTAQTIVVQTITSSVDFVTGSTIFGTLLENTHQFTGSVNVTGSLNVVGNGITGSLFGTSSWANNAISSSYALSASQAESATTASYVLNAVSASFSTTASYAVSASQAQNAVSSSYPIAFSGTTLYTNISTTNFSTTSSTYIGRAAGNNAPQSNVSVFIGSNAGSSATNASGSVFIGSNAGNGAANSEFSVIIGTFAGLQSTNAKYLTAIGAFSAYQLAGFDDNIVAIGDYAAYRVRDADSSIFIGRSAGSGSRVMPQSICIGGYAGESASWSGNSLFFGYQAGYYSDNAWGSNFIGYQAGYKSPYSYASNFIGDEAGYNANNSYYSNFIGARSGYSSSQAYSSNFIGSYAGDSVPNVRYANFIGSYAGRKAVSGSFSILIGYRVADYASSSIGIGQNNIIIGNNITLENERKDSINIGGIIFGTGSYFETSSLVPFSGSANGRIGINQPLPIFSLDVSGSGRYTNGLEVTGSLNAPIITGSIFGTASWANNTISSSYALNASQAQNAVTASYVLNAISASYALSASQAQNSVTASYVLNAVSASYAQTSSYAVNITISGSVTGVDYIDFDTTASFAAAVGRLGYDNGEGTLTLGLQGGNVTLKIGSDLYQYVYNDTTSSMTLGQVVYISGSQGNRIAVKLASATAEQGSANTLGFVAETIAAGAEGWVITEGNLRKLNTTGLIGGKLIYLGTTPGTYTQTPPVAPNHGVRLGYAERIDNTVGSIYVKIDNGYELGELHDVVDSTTSSSFGDLLVRSGSVWINSKQLTGSYGLTGSLSATSFTGSLFGTSSWANNTISASYASNAGLLNGTSSAVFATTGSNVFIGTQSVTGSLNISGSQTFIGTSISIGNQIVTGSLITSGSNILIGNTYLTGSVNITGSTTQTGNNNLLGNTTLSGSVTVSGSLNASANLTLQGHLRLDPGQDPGNNNLTASYLFTSASNTATGYDLYYRQDGNIVKFKWLEGGLSSGVLYGGTISYSGSVIYVKKGTGIINNMNATTGSEINPIITYVNWNDYTASAQYITASQVTYLYVNSAGTVTQQTSFFDQTLYEQSIPLGLVLHPNYSTITGYGSNVQTTYDSDTQQNDFIRAFGPIKVNGFTPSGQSGSLRINVGDGTAFILGGFYTQNQNSPSHYTATPAYTASLARAYRTGSGIYLDSNNGSLYTVVDPSKYDNGNGLSNVPGNNVTIQRIFYNPVSKQAVVYYGQNTYSSVANALTALPSDSFTEGEFTAKALLFVGYLIVQGNASDLTNTSQALFIQSGIFRNTAGGSSGGSSIAQNLDDLSDVTITSPTNGQALIYQGGTWVNGTPLNATSASLAVSASQAQNAVTASYVLNAISSSYALSASQAQNAISASYVLNAVSSSFALTASSADNFLVRGTLTAQTIVVQTITSSTDFVTGSSRFGTLLSNTHQFTGSVSITGSLNVVGNGITGSLFGTSSWANNAVSSSYALSSSQAQNAVTASYVLNAISSSFSTTASYAASASQATNAVTASSANNFTVRNDINLSNTTAGTIYNSTDTSRLNFGMLGAGLSSYNGGYFTVFGNNYSVSTQRGGAEFVFDTRNSGSAGFGVFSYDGVTWTKRMSVDVNGVGRFTNGLQVTGSLNAPVITGSLFGTASWANNSTTASYVLNSISASYALSASQAQNSITASYVLNAISASFATTSSYVLNAVSSSFALSASQAQNAVTASYILNAVSASYSLSASQAQNAVTASYVINAVSSSYALSASFVTSASQAQNAVTASYVLNAVSASFASTASNVLGGAANYVPLWNGTTTLSSSVIYQSGGNVGIGTTSPTALLTLDSAEPRLRLNRSGTNHIIINHDGTTGTIRNESNTPLQIGTNGAAVMTVTGSNVGIGTTSPTEKLTVRGNGAKMLIEAASDPSGYYTYLQSNYDAINPFVLVSQGFDILGSRTATSPVGTRATYLNSYYDISLNTGGFTASLATSKLYISASGNVGIGTTTPNAKLDVNGNAIVSGSLTVTQGITGSLFGTSSWASNAVTASYVLNAVSSSVSSTSSLALRNVLTASAAGSTITFTRGDNTTFNVTLTTATAETASYIASSNVDGPLGKNSILSSSFAQTASYANNFTVAGTLTAQTIVVQTITSSVDFVTGSTRFGSLQSNTHQFTGSVSITGSLNVVGNGITGSLFGTSSWASNAVTASNALTASFVNTLNQNVLITGSLTIGAASVGANENTLIVGPAPAGGAGEGGQILLQATGGTYASASMLDTYQNRFRILRGTNSASDAEYFGLNLHTGQLTISKYTASGSFAGSAVANLSIDSSGNVITTAIGSSLTGGATNYIARWASSTTLTTGSIYDDGTNVGIGTVSSSYKLDVNGSIRATGAIYANANNQLYFQGGDDAALWDINVANTIGIYGAQDSTVGSIKLGSGGGILSGRNSSIGIGTTTPNATLDVNGNAIVSGSLTVTGSTKFGSVSGNTHQFTGSVSITGSLTVVGTGITGSLFGTSSWTSNAVTASYALSGLSSSFATTASYAQIATTASYSNNFTVGSQLTLDATLTDYATVASSVVGSNNLFTQATGSYTSAFFKYTISNGTNSRAGEVVGVWNGTTVQYYDNSTVDVGNTTAVTSSVSIVSGDVQFNIQTNTSGWRIKSLATFM